MYLLGRQQLQKSYLASLQALYLYGVGCSAKIGAKTPTHRGKYVGRTCSGIPLSAHVG
jgi:hypothetical protein